MIKPGVLYPAQNCMCQNLGYCILHKTACAKTWGIVSCMCQNLGYWHALQCHLDWTTLVTNFLSSVVQSGSRVGHEWVTSGSRESQGSGWTNGAFDELREVSQFAFFLQQQYSHAMKRNSLVFLARVAEQTGRFEDMSEMMKGVVRLGGSLTKEEKALLSTAYRHLVGERRVAWRMVTSGYAQSNPSEQEGSADMHNMLDIMRGRIEDEILEYCREMQEILISILQSELCSEGRVSLLKMKGDYHRYVAEISTHEALEDALELAHDSYMKAYMLALKALSPLHDTRLGVALNFSVFFYEVVKDTEKAIVMAKETYRAGLDQVDCGETASKEAVVVLKLLRDNITLWNNLLEMEALRQERKHEQACLRTHQEELAALRQERAPDHYEICHVDPPTSRQDRHVVRNDQRNHQYSPYHARDESDSSLPYYMRSQDVYSPHNSSSATARRYSPSSSGSSLYLNTSPVQGNSSAGATAVGGSGEVHISPQYSGTRPPPSPSSLRPPAHSPLSPQHSRGSPFNTNSGTGTGTGTGSNVNTPGLVHGSSTGVGATTGHTTTSSVSSPVSEGCVNENGSPEGHGVLAAGDRHRVGQFNSPQPLRSGSGLGSGSGEGYYVEQIE